MPLICNGCLCCTAARDCTTKTQIGMVIVLISGGSPQQFVRVVRPRVDVRHKKIFCCCGRNRTDGPSYRAGATKRIVSISRTPTCLCAEPCSHPEERDCQQPVGPCFQINRSPQHRLESVAQQTNSRSSRVTGICHRFCLHGGGLLVRGHRLMFRF